MFGQLNISTIHENVCSKAKIGGYHAKWDVSDLQDVLPDVVGLCAWFKPESSQLVCMSCIWKWAHVWRTCILTSLKPTSGFLTKNLGHDCQIETRFISIYPQLLHLFEQAPTSNKRWPWTPKTLISAQPPISAHPLPSQSISLSDIENAHLRHHWFTLKWQRGCLKALTCTWDSKLCLSVLYRDWNYQRKAWILFCL